MTYSIISRTIVITLLTIILWLIVYLFSRKLWIWLAIHIIISYLILYFIVWIDRVTGCAPILWSLDWEICSLFDDDSYCAVNYGDFIFFVTIQSDDIPSSDDADEFLNIYYDFFRNFEVDNMDALEYYANLKGYEYKFRDDFSVIKIGDDRVIVTFSDMGAVTSLKVLKA